MLVYRPCNRTSGNLNKEDCKRKVERGLTANCLSFSELSDDISLVLDVRRLCVVEDSRISVISV